MFYETNSSKQCGSVNRILYFPERSKKKKKKNRHKHEMQPETQVKRKLKTVYISWDLFNTLLPLDPLINSFCICLFLPSLLLSSLSRPSLPSSRLLRWFRALSCCEGEAGWWGERGRARERPSLSPWCSSHLPALPWWVVFVLVCWSAGFSGKKLCGTSCLL